MSLTKKIYKQHREELEAVQNAPARDKLRVSIEKRLENIRELVENHGDDYIWEKTEAKIELENALHAVGKWLDIEDARTDDIPF